MEPGDGEEKLLANQLGKKKVKPLTVMHWNAEGVSNKKDELQKLLFSKEVDICCIQETYLKKATLSRYVDINNPSE